jgi:sarcosine oxidase
MVGVPMAFDWIVVGLGAMGSAAAYHLARKGVKVLGLEQFGMNHQNGSSHGRSRIIRSAYFEGPAYVPLVKRAFQLWGQLEAEYGVRLLLHTGGLMIGRPDGPLLTGAMRSAREHGLEYQVLSSDEIENRFPVFRVPPDHVGLYERAAGILIPEMCIEAALQLAQRNGAALRFHEKVVGWGADDRGVEVRTDRASYTAGGIIFAAGPWSTTLLGDLNLPLKCERQVVFWFQPTVRRDLFSADNMPIFIWESDGPTIFYGIPEFDGQGVKVARHHGGECAPPEQIRRQVTPEDEQPVRDFLRAHMPWADGPILSATTCLYTNTPDGHFIIDFHPRHRNVIIISACSGHGFKFASSIGEVVQELALEGRSRLNLEPFALKRFNI